MKTTMRYTGVLVVLLILVYLSSILGTVTYSLTDIVHILAGSATPAKLLTFWEFRMPRTLIALLAGAGLGASGFILQKITLNPLADPGILGINAGAGVTVLFYLGFFANGASSIVMPFIACVGSGIAALLVYIFGRKGDTLSPNRLLLSGVAVNAGLSAITLLGTIKISSDNYDFVVSWLAGTLWGASWAQVLLLIPWIVVGVTIALWQSKNLNVLSLGMETATGLGLNVKRTQIVLLVVAVCLAATSVAVAGSISFIGLMSAHIASQMWRKANVATAAIAGGLVTLLADIIGRVLLPSGDLATGIVVSMIGAPYFMFLLLRKKA
jgi:iron complex transport system permease protein